MIKHNAQYNLFPPYTMLVLIIAHQLTLWEQMFWKVQTINFPLFMEPGSLLTRIKKVLMSNSEIMKQRQSRPSTPIICLFTFLSSAAIYVTIWNTVPPYRRAIGRTYKVVGRILNSLSVAAFCVVVPCILAKTFSDFQRSLPLWWRQQDSLKRLSKEISLHDVTS